ncbi:MAG: tRNA lysidine(34) synthetase TilS, partial [Desulfobulbaceae bacterium]
MRATASGPVTATWHSPSGERISSSRTLLIYSSSIMSVFTGAPWSAATPAAALHDNDGVVYQSQRNDTTGISRQRFSPRKYSMSPNTLTQVITGNKLFTLHQRVVVGVSGGPDSMALLQLLAEADLALDCIAAYIDHGLRPHETGAEKRAVERLARDCGALFCCRAVPVREHAAAHGLSLEDAARTLRYQSLEDIRAEYGAEVIAVAHTADDQVEEFFLRLIRGCGRNGMTGMSPRQGRIVRPLLGLRKQELTDFLAERRIPFCIDSSNLDRRFLRNRIRLDLLPMLERQFNPSIRRTILQTMDILREEEDLLGRLGEQAMPPRPETPADHPPADRLMAGLQ